MTVILSRPTTIRKKRVQDSDPLKRIATIVSSFLTPKAKAQTIPTPVAAPSPVIVPVPTPQTTPTPQPASEPTDEPMLAQAILAARDCGYMSDLTECEDQVISALREWRRAETDPEKYAELLAWELIRMEVGLYLAGEYTPESARQGVGRLLAEERFNAVKTIAELLPKFYQDYGQEVAGDEWGKL